MSCRAGTWLEDDWKSVRVAPRNCMLYDVKNPCLHQVFHRKDHEKSDDRGEYSA